MGVHEQIGMFCSVYLFPWYAVLLISAGRHLHGLGKDPGKVIAIGKPAGGGYLFNTKVAVM